MNYKKYILGIGLAILALLISNCSKNTDFAEEELYNNSRLAREIMLGQLTIKNQKQLTQFIYEDDDLSQMGSELIVELVNKTHFDVDGIMNFDLSALKDSFENKDYIFAQRIIDNLGLELNYLDLEVTGSACNSINKSCVPAQNAYCGKCNESINYGGIGIGELLNSYREYIIKNLNKDFVYGYGTYSQLPKLQTSNWYFKHFYDVEIREGEQQRRLLKEYIESGEIKVFGNVIMVAEKKVYVAELIIPQYLKNMNPLFNINGLLVNNYNFLWMKNVFCNCEFKSIPLKSYTNCQGGSFEECFSSDLPILMDHLEYGKLVKKITNYKVLDRKILEVLSYSSVNELVNTPELLNF